MPRYITTIANLMTCFKNIKLRWIPRKLNTKAHSLSKDPFLEKYTEYRAKKIHVEHLNGSTYLSQSSKDKNKYYIVDLNLCACTYRFLSYNIGQIERNVNIL